MLRIQLVQCSAGGNITTGDQEKDRGMSSSGFSISQFNPSTIDYTHKHDMVELLGFRAQDLDGAAKGGYDSFQAWNKED